MQAKNPFSSKEARKYSSYILPEEQQDQPHTPKARDWHQRKEKVIPKLRQFIQAKNYPCLAARASFKTAAFRAGIYPALADEQVTEGLCRDLLAFIHEKPHIDSQFTTFLAVFETPPPSSEQEFEQLLWQQLSLLDQRSKQFYAWNKEVSDDPEAENFSFSFGGHAFFVVGMHPKASRLARRFSYPLLAFNPHEQFEELKKKELYTGFKNQIRERDKALQGSLNPMVEDFGKGSEARQYAGRKIEKNWKCPFTPKEI